MDGRDIEQIQGWSGGALAWKSGRPGGLPPFFPFRLNASHSMHTERLPISPKDIRGFLYDGSGLGRAKDAEEEGGNNRWRRRKPIHHISRLQIGQTQKRGFGPGPGRMKATVTRRTSGGTAVIVRFERTGLVALELMAGQRSLSQQHNPKPHNQ